MKPDLHQVVIHGAVTITFPDGQNPFDREIMADMQFPYIPGMYPKAVERFWFYVVKSESCWPWRGAKDLGGYGVFGINYNTIKAHRFSYWIMTGPVPADLCVCHHCDVPGCCNPRHLFLGTITENLADAFRKRRHSHGARHAASKLSDADIRLIRASNLPRVKLAKQFGVTRRNVAMILNSKTWRHVT